MSKLPDWVLKHKKKGMAVEKRGDKYYLTRVTSVWDPEKKRARKITLEYLGRITPDGVIPPKRKQEAQIGGILDAGNLLYIREFSKPIENLLREYFPHDWQSIISIAAIKLCYGSPFKQVQFRHLTSISKQLWPEAALSKNSITKLLERLGSQWPIQREFFSEIARIETHMAIDLSHIFTQSKNIPWAEYGYNGDHIRKPQVNILLMWGITTNTPGFLKLLPGSTHSAKTLINAIRESGIQEVIVVADKGFWSQENLKALEKTNLEYVLALPRTFSMIKYIPQSQYKHFFRYRDRVQWWHSIDWDGRKIYNYLDKELAVNEESAYLRMVEEGQSSMSQYRKIRNRFGTLALLTDTGLDAEKVYNLYKARKDIEHAFDTLQNTLGADTTWMQSRISFQGYLFIMFVALYLYSKILDHLKRKDLLNQYSVNDTLTYLSKVTVVEVNRKTKIGEIPEQTKKMIKRIEIPITKKLGI